MAEHRFYCGLSEEQRRKFPEGGQSLFLGPEHANVALHIDDIRARYRRELPDYLLDLLELATYVFAADNVTSRGGKKREDMAAKWRRTFLLVVTVRRPEIWRQREVVEALQKALHFISDDNWKLEFIPSLRPSPADVYLNLRSAQDDGTASSSVVLFSGGLDSLSGAVRELMEDRQSVVLVSHRSAPIVANRQDRLVRNLRDRFGERVFHVPVRAHMTSGLRTHEFTQRTRSFLFTALAAVVAELEQSTTIKFYENGVMSINLPPSTHYVGTRASRTTHPHALFLLQDALRRVSPARLAIDNPYIWMTKADVIKELAAHGGAELIPFTISCTRTREADAMHPHCGRCVQCLQRRLSVLFAGVAEHDPAEFYAIDLLEGARTDALDRAMSVDFIRSALEISRSTDLAFLSAYGGHTADLSAAFPGLKPNIVSKRVIELFHRYADEVYSVLSSGFAAQGPPGSRDAIVPDSSLSIIARDGVEAFGEAPVDTRIRERAQRPAETDDTPDPGPDGIVLIIDQQRSELEIDSLGLIDHGQTIYAIVSRLAQQRQRDTEDGVSPREFRAVRLREIASELAHATDSALRSAISRFLQKVEQEHQRLYPDLPKPKEIIENIPGKGYRINPFVQLHWRTK
jgi:7-cyano-7-deazaguanine synthase in queuosine biosynthesis